MACANRRWMVGCVTLVFAGAAATKAAEQGTPAEAQAMLGKAIAHYKAVGRTQALADFNKKVAPFADRDLYVVCLAPDRTIVANGGFPSYVGTSADLLRDAEGKALGKALLDAGSKGEGAVRYQALNPVSHKIEPKVSFVQKAGDGVCLVGAYGQ
jgi:cytochrome c